METHGEKIKQIRKNNGHSQQFVAEKTGLKRVSVASIEQNNQRPPFDFLIAFAKLYNVSLDDIAGLNTEDKSDDTHVPSMADDNKDDLDVYVVLRQLEDENDPSRRKEMITQLSGVITNLQKENSELKSMLVESLRKNS